MKKIHIISSVMVVALGIFGIYFLSLHSSAQGTQQVASADAPFVATSSPLASSTIKLAAAIASPAPPPPGYIKYQNNKYGFSFYHSTQASINEFDEGRGAMTIVLQNNQKVRGMQIFIVPYHDTTISDERFKADVPSGIRTNVEKTYVDGVEAVTFNSFDAQIGDTREVWFIRGGYLFEVTTFKGVADWFAPIMQTWKFL